MNFIGNKVIPATLFAATASFAISAPAQALDFSGVGQVEISGFEVVSDGAGGLDFVGLELAILGAVQDEDGVDIAAWSPYVVGGALNSVGSLTDVSAGALTDDVFAFTFGDGSTLEFDLTSPVSIQSLAPLEAGLLGDLIFTDATGVSSIFAGAHLTSQSVGDVATSFSISLTPVPTPAAVLPVLTGLFGVASRKKQEEEA
ncbi:hypothetical protein Lepto7376_2028 [[Leptolyngbya] sp. PCC 7376]|uniref:PTPA-CTERM sorting domain-containing protein n=1 Tax=[Leptolyngbya] sp. PCC 7376 TaxID=111781 RepID=UPI00029EF0AB|nr:PTPA-CTERM sorting domain-containing protein [[Leptolyngbya] sp. PCC 7376]AFY38330.1 hypothetical protein Lepto7376_2028 [[Leptolyngbya] sp. PCC 7376]